MGTIKYDKNLLTHLVNENLISNRLCESTGSLIFPNEGYYYLDGCVVSDLNDNNLNSFIEEYYGGEYESYEDLCNWNDEVYWSNNYDVEGVVLDILECERFYNTKGEIVWVNGTIPF